MKITDEIFNKKIKPLIAQSTYCSIATVSKEGIPHVTPIGSVIIKTKDKGIFFEKFTKNIPENSKQNQLATIMFVNDGNWFWLKSLFKGQFKTPPAIRMVIKFGKLRQEKDEEGGVFKRKVKMFSFTKGHQILWSDMSHVREFEIIDFKPVFIGKMTREQFI